MCYKEIIEILSAISVIVASLFAIYGILKWKKEIVYRRKFELAEIILANAYEAVDVIQFIRFPGSRANEGQTRKPEEDESPKETEFLNRLYVIKERFLQRDDCFKNLFSVRYNVKTIMGKEIEKNLNIILNMPRRIFNSVDEYIDVIRNPKNFSEEDKKKIQKNYSQSAFAHLTDKTKDSIYLEMNEALRNLEKYCGEILN